MFFKVFSARSVCLLESRAVSILIVIVVALFYKLVDFVRQTRRLC